MDRSAHHRFATGALQEGKRDRYQSPSHMQAMSTARNVALVPAEKLPVRGADPQTVFSECVVI